MRITAGTAGGTILASPKGPAIRPTPDKVKQAVFSSLGERVVGARVLDLFTGSGALGLEALSRGAASAALVDASRFCMEAVRTNADKARLLDLVEVHRSDSIRFIEQLAQAGKQFDLIFADPPYEKSRRSEASLARKLLNCPALVSILAPDGLLVLEHFKDDSLEAVESWEVQRELRHGDTVVVFLRAPSSTRTTSTRTKEGP